MKKIVSLAIVALLVVLAGCQSKETKVFVEKFSLDSQQSDGFSFTKPQMSAYDGYFVLHTLSSNKPYKSTFKCLDMNKGTFTWYLQVGVDAVPSEDFDIDFKAFNDRLFINQGDTLCRFDLKTGGPIWQTKEKIDYVLKAEQDKIFCLSPKMTDNGLEYRKLLCFCSNKGEMLWSSKIPQDSNDVRVGESEVVYFTKTQKPISVHVLSKETGSQLQKLLSITKVIHNLDNPSNFGYIRGNQILMHTSNSEEVLLNLDDMPGLDKAEFIIENNRLYIGSTEKKQFDCYTTDGKKVWSRDLGVMDMIARTKCLDCFITSSSKNEYQVEGIDPVTGKKIWNDLISLDNRPFVVVSGDYAIYQADYYKVLIRQIETGEVVQSLKFDERVDSVWEIPGFGIMVACADSKLHFLVKTE